MAFRIADQRKGAERIVCPHGGSRRRSRGRLEVGEQDGIISKARMEDAPKRQPFLRNWNGQTFFPALKRRAIIECSFGTGLFRF